MERLHLFLRLRWCFGLVLSLTVSLACLHAAEGSRFTDSLTPQQRSEIGLERLSSDNVAVINALVRQDDGTAQLRNNTIRSTRFSARRTDHERDIAGLKLLTAEQISTLDQLIGQRFAPAPSPLLEASTFPSVLSISAVERMTGERRPEIHGSFSLTYGWGKGGSVMGGDATLFYQDPEHRYSVLFNYSQYRGKGEIPWIYPGDSLYPYPYRSLPDLNPIDR